MKEEGLIVGAVDSGKGEIVPRHSKLSWHQPLLHSLRQEKQKLQQLIDNTADKIK